MNQLREIRKARGMTQKQVAERLERSVSTYQDWELGRRNPKLSSLLKISKVFGCNINDLIDIQKNKEEKS